MHLSKFFLCLVTCLAIFVTINGEETKELLAELNNVLDDIQIKSKKEVIQSLLKSRKEDSSNTDAHIPNLGKQLDEVIRQYHLEDEQADKTGVKVHQSPNDIESASRLLQKEVDEIIARRNLKNEVTSKKEILSDSDEEITNAINELEKSGNENHLANQEKVDLTVLAAFAQAEQKRKREAGKCFDEAGSGPCYQLAFTGKCNSHSKVMQGKCKRSCNFCCGDETTFMPKGQCAKYRELGLCSGKDHQDRLRIFCPKTCGFCGRASTEIPCVRSTYGCCWDGSIAQGHLGTPQDKCPECEDSYPTLCQRFSNHCGESWGKAGVQVRRMCPKTCRMCGAHKLCRDRVELKSSCIQMKYEGMCNTFKVGMAYQCAKTCDLCNHSTVSCTKTIYGCCGDGKSIAQGPFRAGCPECTDKHGPNVKCSYWQKFGACNDKNLEEKMRVLCAGTCGYCKKP